MSQTSSKPTGLEAREQPAEPKVTAGQIADAAALAGLEFTDGEMQMMLPGVNDNLSQYEKIRSVELPNYLAPAWHFDPRPRPPHDSPVARRSVAVRPHAMPPLPSDLEDLAFWPVTHLSTLIRTRQVTSQQLTEMYLARLKRIGPRLECVVTLTEDLALEQARRADAEIGQGVYRGPLHGIPWGAKDLLATKRARTTWGATPYKDQVIDMNATVVDRLEAAGAVLVAKLTMGALAWGDVWFGGKTRSPWNTEEGSSGSSAGSGSATAAGLVGFAIGTETYGSIVSPSTACGVSGLRPTFGRVSRHGAMALCWTLDKIGPMCRSVEDCALVFDAIRGPDGHDPTVIDAPFDWPLRADFSRLRIGYVEDEFEEERPTKAQDAAVLDVLRSLGATLVPIKLPDYPINAAQIILWVEAAAAFDELTRSNRDDLLVRQVEDAWPNRFRVARTIPAVEYVQANRLRTLVMRAMDDLMADIDVYVSPSLGNANRWLTNATGHPVVVTPTGWRENGLPTTILFTGRLYDEATVLAVALAYQEATEFHLAHPTLED